MINITQDVWAAIESLKDIAAARGFPQLTNWFWQQRHYPWSDCMVTKPGVQWKGAGDQCTPCFPGPDVGHPVYDLSKSLCKKNTAACGTSSIWVPLKGGAVGCGTCASARLNCPAGACGDAGCKSCLAGQYLARAGDLRAIVLRHGRERKPFNTCRACKAAKPYGYGAACTACTANGCTHCRSPYVASNGECITPCKVPNCTQCMDGLPLSCKACAQGFTRRKTTPASRGFVCWKAPSRFSSAGERGRQG